MTPLVSRTYGDAVAVEMEGHGFLLGVHMSEPTQGIVVRGISDLLNDKDEANDDKWQPVAASHAAAFAFQVLSKLTPEESGHGRRAEATQQVMVGDIWGDNNTLNVYQHQVPPLDELARLIRAVVPDANAEIDAAAARIQAGESDIAIHLLTEMRKKRWDTLTPRERYRLCANIGRAMEQKGELRKAGQHLLEAKQHQPQDERARALEAVAYYYLDDKAKAYHLAGEVIKDHPNCPLAIAVRIRSAPPAVPFALLEEIVPAALREELDILHALGWRALTSGDLAAADRIASAAVKRFPDSVEMKEQLATVIVQVEARAKLANQRVNRQYLEEAVAALTAGIAQRRGRRDEARLRYSRAEAYDLLGRTEDAEIDFRAAVDADNDEPDVVRRFALFLERHDRIDAAIEALRQADKVKQNPTNRLMLAGLLGVRKGNGDWEAAIAVLRETISVTPGPEARAGMVAELTQLLGLSKRHDEAISYLDGLSEDFLRPPVIATIRSSVLLRARKKEEAHASAMQALEALAPDSPETDRMRVAEALGHVGEKQQALNLWKNLLKPDRMDPFVLTALDQARECEDDAFIMTFCEGLREIGIRHPFAMELEVMTREKYRMFDQAIAIMLSYLGAPPSDEKLARVFRVRLSLLGKRLSRPELIETDVAKLPPVETAPTKVGAATAYILRNGPCPTDGVKYAYELVRRNYDDPTARQAYFAVMGVADELLELIPVPSAVAPGCAVQYRIDGTSEEKWVIIEDGVNPRYDHEEIGPNHEWAQDMAGKGVGDQFLLRRDPIQSRTATIQAILSKYVYRKLEVMNSWEDRFPHIYFVRKYTFPTKEDGSPDIAPILKALDLKEERVQQMHAIYRDNPMSVTSFAAMSDAGVLESLSHLASEGSLPVRCCRGTVEEMNLAHAAIVDANALVIDPSALATLFFSGQYDHLRNLPGKCVVCESALEEYAELYRQFTIPPHGFAGRFKGKYLFRKDDPEERERQETRLTTFLAGIRPLVTLRTGENLARINAEQRREMVGLFGQPTAEALVEAAATGAVLWTDDMAVAEVARHHARVEKRVWTQAVFITTASSQACDDIALFLLQWRYFFTRIHPGVVVPAGSQAEWDAERQPLAALLRWLSAPELQEEGAITVGASMLPLIWRHAPLLHQRETVTRVLGLELLKREGGRDLVAGIIGAIDTLFKLDVIGGENCKRALQAVLDRRTPGGLFLPPGINLAS
jgi:tetratricopeptide (TPR) repeat protein